MTFTDGILGSDLRRALKCGRVMNTLSECLWINTFSLRLLDKYIVSMFTGYTLSVCLLDIHCQYVYSIYIVSKQSDSVRIYPINILTVYLSNEHTANVYIQ
jgi:hypothetical protein